MTSLDTLPTKFIALRPLGGLGTRLYAMCAYAVYAAFLDLPLLIYWTASHGFEDVAFADLFDTLPTGMQLISAELFVQAKSSSHALESMMPELAQQKDSRDFRMQWLYRRRAFRRLNATVYYDFFSINPTLAEQHIPEYTEKIQHLFAQFRPCEACRASIHRMITSWDPARPVVGLHMRRDDALLGSRAYKIRKRAPDRHFHKIAGAAMAANQQLFLATDAANAVEQFRERYDVAETVEESTEVEEPAKVEEPTTVEEPAKVEEPTTVEEPAKVEEPTTVEEPAKNNNSQAPPPKLDWYCFPWQRHPHTPHGLKGSQRAAVVDLFVLRCCDELHGTAGSEFTRCAGMRLDRAHVIAEYAPSVEGWSPGAQYFRDDAHLAMLDNEAAPSNTRSRGGMLRDNHLSIAMPTTVAPMKRPEPPRMRMLDRYKTIIQQDRETIEAFQGRGGKGGHGGGKGGRGGGKGGRGGKGGLLGDDPGFGRGRGRTMMNGKGGGGKGGHQSSVLDDDEFDDMSLIPDQPNSAPMAPPSTAASRGKATTAPSVRSHLLRGDDADRGREPELPPRPSNTALRATSPPRQRRRRHENNDTDEDALIEAVKQALRTINDTKKTDQRTTSSGRKKTKIVVYHGSSSSDSDSDRDRDREGPTAHTPPSLSLPSSIGIDFDSADAAAHQMLDQVAHDGRVEVVPDDKAEDDADNDNAATSVTQSHSRLLDGGAPPIRVRVIKGKYRTRIGTITRDMPKSVYVDLDETADHSSVQVRLSRDALTTAL